MNKRDAVFSLLDASKPQKSIPAAFFLHFDARFHSGQAGVDKHLEYFRATGMDFVKIQYERTFPHQPHIQRPEDWAAMPFFQKDFYEPQLNVVEGLVKAVGKEAPVIITLYSPFMCAGHAVGEQLLVSHIEENPQAVNQGMQIITESLMIFVKECIRLGVDGFYHSTQGGEVHRFADRALFQECVKPYDLTLMNEINQRCSFNILHICDYHDSYDDLTPFLDYPGDVVNCSLELGDRTITPQEVENLFGRPFMGGMERKGILSTGSLAQARQAGLDALSKASDHFILGADCTVPSTTPWENLRAVIDTAHAAYTTH